MNTQKTEANKIAWATHEAALDAIGRIKAADGAFLDFSRALYKMDAEKWYKEIGHSTFQKYVEAVFLPISGYGYSQAKNYRSVGRLLDLLDISDDELAVVGYATMYELSRLTSPELVDKHFNRVLNKIRKVYAGEANYPQIKEWVRECLAAAGKSKAEPKGGEGKEESTEDRTANPTWWSELLAAMSKEKAKGLSAVVAAAEEYQRNAQAESVKQNLVKLAA